MRRLRNGSRRALALALAGALSGAACGGGGDGGGGPPATERGGAAGGGTGADSTVTVTRRGLDLAGLRTALPRPGRMPRSRRVLGRLEWDPASEVDVRLPSAGEFRLAVATGEKVRRAQRLGWLLSPESYPDSFALRAPRAGVVTGLPAGSGGTGQAWQLVARLASPDTLRLEIPVFPGDVPGLAVGTPLEMEAAPGVRARVGAFEPADGDAPAPLLAVSRVPNRRGSLWPGMWTEVSLALGDTVSGQWLPAASVVVDRAREVVFVRQGKGYVERPVTVVRRRTDSVFVTGPLASDQEVVAQGAYQLLYAGFSFRGIGAEAGESDED